MRIDVVAPCAVGAEVIEDRAVRPVVADAGIDEMGKRVAQGLQLRDLLVEMPKMLRGHLLALGAFVAVAFQPVLTCDGRVDHPARGVFRAKDRAQLPS